MPARLRIFRLHPLASRLSTLVTTVALLALLPSGCRRHELAAGVTDSAFVSAMAELERIDRAPGMDSLARAKGRATILQGRGLTRAQLEAAAGSLADDPKRALALYREIERRASGDTTTRRPPGAAAAAARDSGVPAARRRQ